MNITLLCLFVPVILLAPVGFGGLMATIGKVRGWDPKRTFWVSSLGYLSLMIGQFLALWYANDMLHFNFAYDAVMVISIVLIVTGLIFSPLLSLAVRWKYPDLFRVPAPDRATPNTTAQAAVEREPVPQKSQPSGPGAGLQSRPEPVTPPVTTPDNAVTAGHIFISYRRSDSADIAGRIYDRLVARFGEDPVFKDVDSIPLGLDFKEYLDKKVGECNVLLAIIGDRWLDANYPSGEKRLDDPSDFVRIEIESALERGIPVIPLLVRDAKMPPEERLPSSLRKLVYRNGTLIRSDPDFHRDMDRLIAALEKYVR